MSKTQNPPSICFVCDNALRYEQAQTFAEQQKLDLLKDKDSIHDLQLIFAEDHIELYDRQLNTSIYVDFVHGALAHRQQFGGGRGQAIAKAIGLKQGKNPNVLDVTAGLARDAYILATLGCRMTLVEKSPILCQLILDGINRGLNHEHSAHVLTDSFELHQQDAIDYLKNMTKDQYPDVVYLDPMFPERKKSALVKKDMQILQRLLGKDENNAMLLESALRYARERVVVKRPAHAPFLADKKPAASIHSKKTRYDIYLITTSATH
ncbi:MAG: class I SAM-dependent methyltransferase [Gammaproteobacteria bacterium]|nr:class I SAM-dependent methyltransferase [Gammaproteobacteria bacterium]